MHLKKFIVFIFIVVGKNAFSFDYDECASSFKTANSGALSTTQFTSSWGACSAIALEKHKEFELFYAVNKHQVQNEIAMGRGEYVETILALSECSRHSSTLIQLQENYPALMKLSSNEFYEWIQTKCSNSRN